MSYVRRLRRSPSPAATVSLLLSFFFLFLSRLVIIIPSRIDFYVGLHVHVIIYIRTRGII